MRVGGGCPVIVPSYGAVVGGEKLVVRSVSIADIGEAAFR